MSSQCKINVALRKIKLSKKQTKKRNYTIFGTEGPSPWQNPKYFGDFYLLKLGPQQSYIVDTPSYLLGFRFQCVF